MAKNTETEALSKSKAKRQERQKEVAKTKKQKLIGRIITTIVLTVIIAVFAVAAGFEIYKAAIRTKSSTDYSIALTEEGLIKNADVASAVSLADYENLVVPLDAVIAAESDVESDIHSTLEAHQELKSDSTLKIADGDTVNIDYVGTVDGVEFDGGNSNGEGYDLVIGSQSFIDDFEQQLIGHSPGEEVTVNVTFPDGYTDPSLSNKEAQFAVTIHGIYVLPELTDEFVQTNYPDVASTAEEYRKSIEDNYYNTNLRAYMEDYIYTYSSVSSYPEEYVECLKSTLKYADEYSLEANNQMYQQYGITSSYNEVWDMIDGIDNEIDYEKDLTERAKEAASKAMIYQAIFEKAGLSLTFEEVTAKINETYGEEYAATVQETYGKGYMIQSEMQEAVLDYLVENANVQPVD